MAGNKMWFRVKFTMGSVSIEVESATLNGMEQLLEMIQERQEKMMQQDTLDGARKA